MCTCNMKQIHPCVYEIRSGNEIWPEIKHINPFTAGGAERRPPGRPRITVLIKKLMNSALRHFMTLYFSGERVKANYS